MQVFRNLFNKHPTGPITENIGESGNFRYQPGCCLGDRHCNKDMITAAPDGNGEAMRALTTQLKSKSPITVNYAISVLDYYMHNCEFSFRQELSSRDNINFIQKFLIREDLAPENRGRMLEVIATWAQKFETPSEIRRLYHKLVGLGYRFPNQLILSVPSFAVGVQPFPQQAQSQVSISRLSAEERKNHVEFDISLAENAVQVLLETLTYADKNEDLTQNEILGEFRQKCHHMQERIGRLLSEVPEEDLVAKLIQVNSDIISAFEQYNDAVDSRAVALATAASQNDPTLHEVPKPPAPSNATVELLQIDFEREAAHGESTEDLVSRRRGNSAKPVR
ncbi:hypothetical protein BC829DRAFT_493954 [Chytridium lagenaria]|nr:hypothetical protein BC829DRAFT_493954 [Chytridium lagenaria]